MNILNFDDFIILLIISIVVSAFLHFVMKYYIRPGIGSFISKVIFGWIGAWLGTPVFGQWFEFANYEGIYIIPAVLGSLAILVILVDFVKTTRGAEGEKPTTPQS